LLALGPVLWAMGYIRTRRRKAHDHRNLCSPDGPFTIAGLRSNRSRGDKLFLSASGARTSRELYRDRRER
jgi:hypothetical protein